MIVRRGVLSDVDQPGFRALIREGLYSSGIPPEMADEEKMWAYCRSLESGLVYGAVAIEDSRYVGYIGGSVTPHWFLARSQLTISAWYSNHPGAGMRLLRDCLAWARAQVLIRQVLITVNDDSSARLRKILGRKVAVFCGASFLIEV